MVMQLVQSLAEYLKVEPTVPTNVGQRLEDITDAKAFAEAVLSSREFRCYIVNAIILGILPSAITCRLMDYAWGKPLERIEHTGKDGQPIEVIAEVRRVVVRAQACEMLDEADEGEKKDKVIH